MLGHEESEERHELVIGKKLQKGYHCFFTLLTETDPGMSFARRGIGAERALSMQNVTQN